MAKRTGPSWSKEMYRADYNSRFYEKQFGKDYEKIVRSEYTRLRDIAQKRLKRLEKSEFAQTETYRLYKDEFPKLAEITKGKEVNASLIAALSELAQFVSSPLSTIKGQQQKKNKTIATLQEHGVDVSAKDFHKFANFMKDTKHYIGSRQYDSDIVLDVWKFGRTEGISTDELMENFDIWYANHTKLSKITKTDNEQHDSSYYLKRLEDLKSKKKKK